MVSTGLCRVRRNGEVEIRYPEEWEAVLFIVMLGTFPLKDGGKEVGVLLGDAEEVRRETTAVTSWESWSAVEEQPLKPQGRGDISRGDEGERRSRERRDA